MNDPIAAGVTPTTDGETSPSPPAASSSMPAVQSEVDSSNSNADYANFCRLAGMPEELLVDFGLNPNPVGTTNPVAVTSRIVVSWYTAKRLLRAMQVAVERYETAFGVLETDVQKRFWRGRA